MSNNKNLFIEESDYESIRNEIYNFISSIKEIKEDSSWGIINFVIPFNNDLEKIWNILPSISYNNYTNNSNISVHFFWWDFKDIERLWNWNWRKTLNILFFKKYIKRKN